MCFGFAQINSKGDCSPYYRCIVCSRTRHEPHSRRCTHARKKLKFRCALILLLIIVQNLFSIIHRRKERTTSNAKDTTLPCELKGNVIKVIDGDTIKLAFPHLPKVFREISCRLHGIDAPELKRSRCCQEKCLAKAAKRFLQNLHPVGSTVSLTSATKGKFFRLIANLSTNHGDTSGLMLNAGFAVQYYGSGARFDWCNVPQTQKIKSQIEKHCGGCGM